MADDESLWQPLTHRQQQQQQQQQRTEVPRWQYIRTQAEQQDIENSLCALESKLARLKSRPIKTKQQQQTDIQYQEEIWDRGEEDEDHDDDIPSSGRKVVPVEENNEGLYLLWRERAKQKQQRKSEDEEDDEDELDRALEQQKREEEYTWHWTLNWIPKYCSCCFTITSSSS